MRTARAGTHIERASRAGVALWALLLCSGLLLARGPDEQAPVRDEAAVPAPPRGTSAITGVVLSADAASRPLSRAIVTVAGAGLPSARSVITDDAGRFVVTGLPAGAYTVTGRKAAFIDGAYGATRPGRPGTAIVIAAGQRADVRVVLARGGVIAGTIRDQAGRPRRDVFVGVINTRDARVEQFFATGSYVRTNDLGAYRLFGLAPGEYVVTAFQRLPGAGEIGRWRTAEIDELLAELSRRNPASTATAPSPSPLPPAPRSAVRPEDRRQPPLPSPESATLAPVYYPGVSLSRLAEPVRVAAGEERTRVDFALGPIATTTIEGQVREPSGATLAGIDLAIDSEDPRTTPSLGANLTLTTPPGSEGLFKYTSVAPGRYTIVARARTSLAPPQPAGRGGGTVITANVVAPAGAYLYAVADIDVTGAPIRGVALTLRPGVTARGRVVFDGVDLSAEALAAADAGVPPDITQVRVLLEPPGVSAPSAASRAMNRGAITGPIFGSVPPPAVAADGTFTATNIAPGLYVARAQLPAGSLATWWLRSITSGGRDLLDAPLRVTDLDLDDLVVTFSNRHSELAGTLQTPAGQPAPEYHVVVFTSDRSLWRAGSRRIQVTRPDTRGLFSLRDLPAGEYHVAALTDVAEGEWHETAFLETLVASSIRVIVREGARTVQNIRLLR